ncbi:MAG: tyrosine-type recombinase/integrase [Ruthenibacterium sp.]
MTGSLQIKNNIYYMVLNVYNAQGKRKPQWISTRLSAKGNKKKAEQLLRETLLDYEQKQINSNGTMRLSDAIRVWLKYIAPQVDAVTLQGYSTTAQGHVLPYFDALGIPLHEVTRQTLQAYIDEKFAHGRKDGAGGLSPASLRQHKNILNQTLNMAVENEWIAANPCMRIKLPQRTSAKACFLNATQINQLLDAIRDEPLFPLVQLTAIYGLRRSEVLGLKWDSIDFENGTFTIKHTVVKVTETVEKDKTKNNASRRTFPLTPEVSALFHKAKEQENSNRKLFGKNYQNNDYVLKWANGAPFTPDYVSHKFKKLLQKHALPPIRFHDLRHSCASNLIALGFSLKDVQEWLGHSDIQTTGNIYAHLDPGRKKNIASEMTSRLTASGTC